MQADFFTMEAHFYEWLPAGTPPPPPLLCWLGGQVCRPCAPASRITADAATWEFLPVWIIKAHELFSLVKSITSLWWLLRPTPCRLRDPASRLSWRESSFLTAMSQNQSSQTTDFFSQDVVNQLFDILDQWVVAPKQLCSMNVLKKTLLTWKNCLFSCFRSAIHTVQPIELNFSDSPTDGSAGNTIQISMDCITMHEPEEMLAVSAQVFFCPPFRETWPPRPNFTGSAAGANQLRLSV